MQKMHSNTLAEQTLLWDLIKMQIWWLDITKYMRLIKADDFYDQNTSLVFNAIKSLFEKRIKIDLSTLNFELKKTWEFSWGLVYCAWLTELSPVSNNISSHFKQLRDISIRRKIELKWNELIDLASNKDRFWDELLDDAIEMISDIDLATWTFNHVKSKTKIQRAREELLATKPNEIIKWWWREWDNLLWWIYWWKIYVIWADTWIWKSTFINQVCKNITRQWHRVVKYSLEDRMSDIWKEEIFYTVNKLRFKDRKKKYSWVKFVNNEYWHEKWSDLDQEFNSYVGMACTILEKEKIIELDKEKQVTINDLCRLMEQECKKWTKFFAIDHLHYFEMKKTERHDLEIQNVMHKINEIARKYNVAVFIVAHYKYRNDKQKHNNDSFKDWSAIKQVANIIIHIKRDLDDDDWSTKFEIWKIRWPIKPETIIANFDIDLFEYQFIKTEAQKKHDLKFNI